LSCRELPGSRDHRVVLTSRGAWGRSLVELEGQLPWETLTGAKLNEGY
jgi:hypothetical protein